MSGARIGIFVAVVALVGPVLAHNDNVSKSVQPLGGAGAVSTGHSAIDAMLGSAAADEGAASAPLAGGQRAPAARNLHAAASDPESSQSLRDALMREAAVYARNQRLNADQQVLPPRAGQDEADQAVPERRQTGAPQSDEITTALKSVLATLRDHRNWMLGAALVLAGLAAAVSLSRGLRRRGTDRPMPRPPRRAKRRRA